MVENLNNNPRMRDITEYNEVTQNAIKESLEKYKTEGITKSSESIDNYFERMVREIPSNFFVELSYFIFNKKKNSTYFGCSFYNRLSSLSAKSFCLLGYKWE